MDDTTNKALHSLDLAPGASLDDVKKSYRELALIWHPDKVPDRVKDRATAKFTEINEAYQWLVRNPENLRMSSSSGSTHQSTSQRQSPPRYRSSSRTSHTRAEYSRPSASRSGASRSGASRSGASGPGASGRTGASWTDASSGAGTGSSTDPAVQRVRQAARGIWTDTRAGLYVYPDIDADRAANFIVALQLNHRFSGVAATLNDLLVFYDIDGSGEEGMAITRSNHLVNNNTGTLYDIGDLVEVRLKEGFFFWSEIVVRRKGSRKFELAGYAENGPGRALVSILGNLIGDD
ncbi:MAG: J domain-containing protein [Gemmatimonadetes bacterium]|nr:J domain-containing protein [Gemmatimonadota bacterium]